MTLFQLFLQILPSLLGQGLIILALDATLLVLQHYNLDYSFHKLDLFSELTQQTEYIMFFDLAQIGLLGNRRTRLQNR